jgi:small-conductance mechanosensitive channel
MTGVEDAIEALETQLSWLPAWFVSVALFGLALAAALLMHRIAYEIMTRLVAGMDLFWRSLVSRTFGPARFTVITLGLSFAASVAPLSPVQAGLIRHILLLCFILLVGWIAKTVLHIWTTVYLRRFKLDADDNLLARKHVTQTRILQRVGEIAIVVIGLSAVLMTFDGVRQYGVSLLASAGAAGLVVGLALQPVLKNIFAGIQLAVTQPIRIDDALLVEGEWGNVEEITSTYVVIRLWDWRRLILPLSYFMEKPFQNWTRESSALIGTVMIYLDYTTPIDALRAKVEEIARGSRLWDGRVVNVQVTDFRQSTMEVRILVSAGTSARTFDLRCEVREKVIAFLQSDHPGALPRLRSEQGGDARGPSLAPLAATPLA